jgi:hypothetical protein
MAAPQVVAVLLSKDGSRRQIFKLDCNRPPTLQQDNLQ